MDLDDQLKKLESEVKHCSEIIGSAVNSESELLKKRSTVTSIIIRIEEEIKEAVSLSPNAMVEELETIRERLSLLLSQFGTVAERKQSLSVKLTEANNALNQARAKLDKAEGDLQALTNQYSSLSVNRKNLEDIIGKFKTQLSRHREEASEMRQVIDEAINTSARMRQEARKLGDEIFSERSPKVIDEELTQASARLVEAQRRNIDPSRVASELKEHQDSYERSRKEVLEGELLLNDMRHGLDKREQVMDGFRKNISQNSLVEFIVLLSARGFAGSLDYDHQRRELFINIHTDGGQSEERGHARDIKQLSGGEKSFGTTCFLLSLWGSIGAPIRCLDEFDVFMDAVNRRIVMDMLVEHARQKNLQFILITPIPLNDFLAANPDIHVVRMKEPRKI